MIHLIIIADILFCSRLYQAVLPDFAQRILLLTMLISAFVYLCIATVRGHAIPVIIAIVSIVMVVYQLYVYEMNWGMPVNWSGSAQYAAVFLFIAVFIISRDGLAPYFAKLLGQYAFLYALMYIAFVVSYHAGLLPASVARPLLLNDAERGDRFFSHISALMFCFFLAIERVKNRFSAMNFLIIVIAITANVLTLSRVYLACFAVVCLISLTRAPFWTLRLVCLGSLSIASIGLLYGMIDTSWNPFYTFASGDTSGIGRALEYEVAQELLTKNPVFGLGLPSVPDSPALVTGISYFASGDLGTVGILLDYGIAGVLLFFAASAIACTYLSILPQTYARALALSGCTMAFYGVIAPNLFAPGGAFYFAVIFGMWLAENNRRTYQSNAQLQKRIYVV